MPRRTSEDERALWTDRKRITNADIPGYAARESICEIGIAIVPTDYEPDKYPCGSCINRQCLYSNGKVPVKSIDRKSMPTRKHPEEMPCGLDVGYDICITQENLFKYAIEEGYDIEDFIMKYMNSDFCQREMDALYSWLQLEFDTMVMSYLLDEITPEKSSQTYDRDAIGWIGWMYRYLQLRMEIPSREIYSVLPLKDMLAYYPDMRTKEAECFLVSVMDRFKKH